MNTSEFNDRKFSSKFKTISKSKIIVALVIVAALVAGGLITYNFINKTPQGIGGPTMVYPEGWAWLSPNEDDKAAGVIFKAGRQDPFVTAIVRKLDGQLDKEVKVEELPSKLEEALKDSLEEYLTLEKKVVKLDGYDAAKLTYRQTNGDKKIGNILYVVPTSDKTYYLTFTSDEDQISKVGQDCYQFTLNYLKFAQVSK